MQNSPKSIAILAANGVDESVMSAVQRLSQSFPQPVSIKVVSTEKALIQTWSGRDWGYSMAVNQKVDVALSADYDALILCGSQRSLDKLGTNPHTKRFIEGIYASSKPMAILGEANDFIKEVLLEEFNDTMLFVEQVNAENISDVAMQVLEFVTSSENEVSMAA
jgi:hypothetical protein